jgi:hypothetical protein
MEAKRHVQPYSLVLGTMITSNDLDQVADFIVIRLLVLQQESLNQLHASFLLKSFYRELLQR